MDESKITEVSKITESKIEDSESKVVEKELLLSEEENRYLLEKLSDILQGV